MPSYCKALRLAAASCASAMLAAAPVAHRTFNANGEPLLDSQMLNGVLIMVVVTAILGPVLTQRFAPGMVESRMAIAKRSI